MVDSEVRGLNSVGFLGTKILSPQQSKKSTTEQRKPLEIL